MATIQQGTFTSAGESVFLPIRSGVDWIEVTNLTEAAAQNINHGFYYEWQVPMTQNNGIVYYHPAADHTVAVTTSATLAVDGFRLYDSSVTTPQAIQAITSISGANPPRVLAGAPVVATLRDGDVVRIINTTGAQQLGGMDFTITVFDATHFDLINMPAIVAAAGPGSIRVIPFDPIFYPRHRSITKITQAAQAVITTSVDHGYQVGDALRFTVPAAFGMVEINGLTGNVVAVTAHTFTIDIDTTAFTAFAFPLTGAVPFTPAIVVPFGEDITYGTLGDATENTATIGIKLAAGITGPAGSNGDVIVWRAGTQDN